MVKDTHALLCIANLLLYEKLNSNEGHMSGVPMIIEKYNEAFAVPNTLIFDGPKVIQCRCRGCNNIEHSFLEAEGVSFCNECKSSLCRFCVWVEDVMESGTSCKTNYCMDCKQRDLGIVGEETAT